MNCKFLTIAAAGLLFGGCFASCGNKKAAEAENDTVRAEESVAAAVATVDEGAPVDNTQAQEGAAVYDAKFFQDPANKDKYKTTDSGLKYVMVKEGTGKQPTAADEVTVTYTGRLLDGTVFDSTDNHGGEPISFPLNRVIPGWTEGMQLMKEGGEMVIYIPSDLGYGPNGTPGGPIPPNADLIFEINLKKVVK